jgi:hypothetical protein
LSVVIIIVEGLSLRSWGSANPIEIVTDKLERRIPAALFLVSF